jgi:serine protease Do
VVSAPIRLGPSAVVRTGQREGLRVVEVLAGSPAEAAGVKVDDVLLRAGSRPVSNAESLQKLLFADAVGVPMTIVVLRDGRELELTAVPAEMDDLG